MAKDSKDPYIVAAVLISYGNAAGQRALYLGQLGINERALAEKEDLPRKYHGGKRHISKHE